MTGRLLRLAAGGAAAGPSDDDTSPVVLWAGHQPGRVYLGSSEPAPRTAADTAADIGVPLGLEREYYINYSKAADEDAFITAALAANRLPWLSYKVSQNEPTILADWAAINNGTEDAEHSARAARYQAHGRPLIITWNTQPDRDGVNSTDGAAWRAAWTRIAGLYADATNVSFVPVLHDETWFTGDPLWWLDDTMLATMPFLGIRSDKTPSNDTFATRLPTVLDWLDSRGFVGKMIGISQCAGYDSPGQTGAQWWTESWNYVVAKAHRIGAVSYHNNNSTPPPETVSTAPSAPGQPAASSITQTGVTLTWTAATAPSGDPVLEYRIYRDGAYLKSAGTSLSNAVTGLTAGTTYSFTVSARNNAGEGARSAARSVTTTADTTLPANTVKVYVAGDIGQMAQYMANNGGQDLTGAMIKNDADKQAVLALGDLAYTDGTYAEFIENYEPYWGPFKGITYPQPGNHEYKTAGAAGYHQYWGSKSKPNGTTWYSFNLGSWHFISLDSNTSTAAGSEQLNWLASDLSAWSSTKGTRPGLCAMWHHPRYTSTRGGSSSVAPFLTTLATYKCDLILLGHDHAYERFNKINPSGGLDNTNGARHFIIGTGGRGLYPLGTVHPQSAVRIHNQWGVVKFTFTSTNYSWLWKPTSGTSSDSGTTAINAK